MRWATDPQGASSGPENVLPLADCQLWYAEIHRRADLPVTANQLAEPVIGHALSGRIPARRVPAHDAARNDLLPNCCTASTMGPMSARCRRRAALTATKIRWQRFPMR